MVARIIFAACAVFMVAAPVFSNSLVSPGPRAGIGKSRLAATANGEWNKLSLNEGRNTEIWTLDGDLLNKVTFFAGIAAGKPLMREADKKNRPLPQVKADMIITDIPVLLETSYRSQYAVNQMVIDKQESAILDGQKAIRFTYSFTKADDDVPRKGEAIGAFVGDQLYLVTYEAPQLYFFDKDIDKFRSLAATIKF